MPEFQKSKLNIAMFPWIAMGHITSFIHAANGLQVEGLPDGVETSADIDINPFNPLAVAFQATSTEVNAVVCGLKPDIVFYDFAHWIPKLAAEVGFKTVCYSTVCASFSAITIVPARHFPRDRPLTGEELLEPPKGYPSSTVMPRGHEAHALSTIPLACGTTTFDVVISTAMHGCDAIGTRTCRELEGPMCDYLSEQYNKPVLLRGPVLPQSPKGMLEEKWDTWLSKFEAKSVVYCAFGSETTLTMNQFQELVLGFEMTRLPFFIALLKPKGSNSIEEALPEGEVGNMVKRNHAKWKKTFTSAGFMDNYMDNFVEQL
ncbi:hypothetical protein BUALT_Bualt07G0138900 [Buddleja alternifolia]|uniref:Uncharacterized protein n=1 Tax=Buddleja alternifolia TaxID=168488 RepID=A0AAV6XBW7_9LAMI|nr:hypothetical protein BUALT_Bualt07G0138900 [Buddleja alternifolia]